jgi:hypothetical protein
MCISPGLGSGRDSCMAVPGYHRPAASASASMAGSGGAPGPAQGQGLQMQMQMQQAAQGQSLHGSFSEALQMQMQHSPGMQQQPFDVFEAAGMAAAGSSPMQLPPQLGGMHQAPLFAQLTGGGDGAVMQTTVQGFQGRGGGLMQQGGSRLVMQQQQQQQQQQHDHHHHQRLADGLPAGLQQQLLHEVADADDLGAFEGLADMPGMFMGSEEGGAMQPLGGAGSLVALAAGANSGSEGNVAAGLQLLAPELMAVTPTKGNTADEAFWEQIFNDPALFSLPSGSY